MKTLLLFAHTFWEDSKINRALLESIKDLDDVKIHNLNIAYPDGKIDVDSEILLLSKAGNIILQFPMFWYSAPSIVKEWQDRVLTNILYGKNPKLLENKHFKIVFTAGGDKSFYQSLDFKIEQILSPFYLSFRHLHTKASEPFCIYGANVDNLPLAEYISLFKA